MWAFDSLCDEFYVATRLFFKLDLAPSRETLLHFFEQVRRAFPGLRRFRRRDGGVVLDELPQSDGQRRYLRLATGALRFGHVAPPGRKEVSALADMILTHAPYELSLSDLDYDSMEIVFGFDLEYAGNHDELIAETLLGESLLHMSLKGPAGRVISCQPCIGFALTEDCDSQAYVEVKARTSLYELRSGTYETQMLSVYLIMRRSFRGETPSDLTKVHQELLALGEALAAHHVVPHVVRPLSEAIATRR